MPENEDLPAKDLRAILHHWFIRYNPLFFLSALSVLSGVFLVSRGLDEMHWREGRLLLTAVVEVYVLLLIAGAALLFRGAGKRRPAVILALIAVLFFLDGTFQTEVTATFDLGLALGVAWTLLAFVKIRTLLWALRLRAPAEAVALLMLAAAAIAFVPEILDADAFNPGLVHLLATWYAVGLTFWLVKRRPRVSSEVPLDDWAATVLDRAQTAAVWIWSTVFFGHLVAWAVVWNVPPNALHVVPLLAFVTVRAREEGWIWTSAALALALTIMADAAATSATAFVLVVILVWRALELRLDRLLITAIVVLHIALQTFGWHGGAWPEAPLWLNLATVALLLTLAWRRQLPTALLPLAVAVPEIVRLLSKLSVLTWGVVLLVLGFTALVAGIGVQWHHRDRVGQWLREDHRS